MKDKAILLYDSECGLCHAGVQFVLKHDSKAYFLFASLHSKKGQSMIRQYGLESMYLDTSVLVEDGVAYVRSDCVLRTFGHLDRPWRYLYVFRCLPRCIRDWLYDRIALNRKLIWRHKNECLLADKTIEERFVDDLK